MKTTILQSLFKIALLLFGMVVGVGCDDSDNPDNRIQEGIEISGILAKTVENGTEIKYPTEITPFLTLRKDLTFEGDAVCNSIKGDYKYSADNGQFKIEGLIATELGCTSPHHEAETMYLDYFRKISSSSKTGKMSGSISGKIAIWSINQYLKKMKTTRTFIIVLTFACVSLLVNAQLSTNELPFSFRVENQHLFIQKNAQINSYKALLPKTVEELNTEDQENEGDNENVPPRFGYPIPVNGI